ncbi:MAG TPA: hypothetical protein VFG49_12400 [Dyella sp.]|uniref:hypothetical protein n=1 Tax=Dyella sp. TaxID=1869338 RepID=UPI002D771175|nr:hypothetical protein [Dyella sp.]HET6554327.1 hypothetical protein [Dyella sp.]
MNKPISTSLLALLFAVAASATVAQTAAPAADNQSMGPFQEGKLNGQPEVKHPAPGDRNCIQSTGSAIPAKKGSPCLSVPGRSYSRQDIQNTGEPTLGPALQKLDPSVTIQGGH